MSTEIRDKSHAAPHRMPPLMPWAIVALGTSNEPDERMMWAQSAVNRFFRVLEEFSLWPKLKTEAVDDSN